MEKYIAYAFIGLCCFIVAMPDKKVKTNPISRSKFKRLKPKKYYGKVIVKEHKAPQDKNKFGRVLFIEELKEERSRPNA